MSQTVLVVGASGYLGAEVAASLQARGHSVVGTYCTTPTPLADVRFDFWTDDPVALADAHDPDTIVFAAAVERADVDTVDTDTGDDFERAVRRLARAGRDRRLVYVSSAAVFDGQDGRYAETASRSPTDAYGRRLATAEDVVREGCPDHAILRTDYLFGFGRQGLDDRLAGTRTAVNAGESVAYFTDMYRSPVLVTEAADAVAALVEGCATGVVHVPAPRTSVYSFHRNAMAALEEPTEYVERDSIPPDLDVAPDRSLASNRFASLGGFEPTPVGPALREQGGETPLDR